MNKAHYIITRFNLGLYDPSYWASQPNPDKWLERRLELFEQYTIPSVKAQDSQDFRWHLLFDNSTPGKYISKINDYQNNIYGKIQAVFCDSMDAYAKQLIRDTKNEYIITTRLDSDDEIRPHFISSIVFHSRNNYSFINFCDGCMIDLNKKTIQRVSAQKSNPFLSAIEKTSEAKTIYCYGNHSLIEKKYGRKVFNIRGRPAWVRYIHNHNIHTK